MDKRPIQPDFRIVLVSPPRSYRDEIGIITDMCGIGLDTYHLRKPDWTPQEIREFLFRMPSVLLSRIVLHTRENLTRITLKGLHRPYRDLVDSEERSMSSAVHSWKEFRDIHTNVDYAFVGPFYNSISKDGYTANKSLHNLPSDVPMKKALALGGVSDKNIWEIRDLGFGGVGVLGYVWNDPDPYNAWKTLQKTRR